MRSSEKPGRVRWILILWMFVISAVAYLDRVNISIAGQFLQRDLNLTNTQLGFVFSAFVFGYALFQAPGGRLADRFGPRLVIALGTLWWSVFTTLSAFAGALGPLIGVRFLLGAGEAVVYPAGNRLVSGWIPVRERGLANGIIFAGVGTGAGLAPPLITSVVLKYGWKWSFGASAVIGLAVGVIWYLLCRDRPEAHPWVGARELAHIRSGIGDRQPAGMLSWRVILHSPSVLAVSASYFTFGYSAYIFFTWFFIYLSRIRGLDLKSSSFYGMLPFLAMAGASPIGGWFSDILTRRFGKRVGRAAMGAIGLTLAAVFVAYGTQVADARLASIVLAGGAGALYLSQSSFWSVTADLARESAGSVSGFMNMSNQIAGTITASLTPWIAGRLGWNASFLAAAALCAAGAAAWRFVNPDEMLLLPQDRSSAIRTSA
jgi:MFS transporter, ACS family, glucarate transporter